MEKRQQWPKPERQLQEINYENLSKKNVIGIGSILDYNRQHIIHLVQTRRTGWKSEKNKNDEGGIPQKENKLCGKQSLHSQVCSPSRWLEYSRLQETRKSRCDYSHNDDGLNC